MRSPVVDEERTMPVGPTTGISVSNSLQCYSIMPSIHNGLSEIS